MILRPLTHSLVGQSRSLQWTAEMDSAFLQVKKALESASLLVHPRPSASLALPVDASATHVGGVLQQFQDGFCAPLAFFSKKLSPTEERYSTFNRELLAAYLAIRHFRFMLEARVFLTLDGPQASLFRNSQSFRPMVSQTAEAPLIHCRIYHRPTVRSWFGKYSRGCPLPTSIC